MAILSSIRHAMAAVQQARRSSVAPELLILDLILPDEGPLEWEQARSELQMWALCGGAERTEAQLRWLLAVAELRLAGVQGCGGSSLLAAAVARLA